MLTDSSEFEVLLAHYPEILDVMRDAFTSHDFISALAQRHQGAYITFLYVYRESDCPFREAHIKLAKGLNRFPERVKKGARANSKDIFGNSGDVRTWVRQR